MEMISEEAATTIDGVQPEIDVQQVERAELPYKSSWIDRLTAWIAALPGPSWVVYLFLFLFLGLISHLEIWLPGEQPWFTFDINFFLYQLWTVEILLFYEFLARDAKNALARFRPLLGTSDDEYNTLEYGFTTLPARQVIYISLIGIPLGLLFLFTIEGEASALFQYPVLMIIGVVNFSFQQALALIFVYRMIRQLRMVSHLYGSVPRIDLYNLEPVYALSSHTAKTGLIFLLIMYSNILLIPGTLQLSAIFITAIILTVIASTAFLLPLRGINRRLVDEKKTMLLGIQQRIKMGFAKVDQCFDEDTLGEIGELKTAISALEGQKAYVEKIPTWPWQPATLRGFLSAVLLPIGIWGIQQVLDRLLNL
jgi:hypothetical protein